MGREKSRPISHNITDQSWLSEVVFIIAGKVTEYTIPYSSQDITSADITPQRYVLSNCQVAIGVTEYAFYADNLPFIT